MRRLLWDRPPRNLLPENPLCPGALCQTLCCLTPDTPLQLPAPPPLPSLSPLWVPTF